MWCKLEPVSNSKAPHAFVMTRILMPLLIFSRIILERDVVRNFSRGGTPLPSPRGGGPDFFLVHFRFLKRFKFFSHTSLILEGGAGPPYIFLSFHLELQNKVIDDTRLSVADIKPCSLLQIVHPRNYKTIFNSKEHEKEKQLCDLQCCTKIAVIAQLGALGTHELSLHYMNEMLLLSSTIILALFFSVLEVFLRALAVKKIILCSTNWPSCRYVCAINLTF